MDKTLDVKCFDIFIVLIISPHSKQGNNGTKIQGLLGVKDNEKNLMRRKDKKKDQIQEDKKYQLKLH